MCKYCPDHQQVFHYPVTFHGLKHHVQCCRHFIQAKLMYPDILQHLKTLGNSQMDLYTGTLRYPTIVNAVVAELKKNNAYSSGKFENWLSPKHYKVIELRDHSSWTITLNADNKRYIHIHPARYSPHTFRVRATSLKTVLAYKILLGPHTSFEIAQANVIRKHCLQLSPISPKYDTILHRLYAFI